PIDLLEHIVTLQLNNLTLDHSAGIYVAKVYEKARSCSRKDKRLKFITSRTKSLTSSQSDRASLSRIPTIEEVEKKQLFAPTKAREELFKTLLIRSEEFIDDGYAQGKNAIQVSFKKMTNSNKPDEERQKLVLQALIN